MIFLYLRGKALGEIVEESARYWPICFNRQQRIDKAASQPALADLVSPRQPNFDHMKVTGSSN
jgi:hypothetical protein